MIKAPFALTVIPAFAYAGTSWIKIIQDSSPWTLIPYKSFVVRIIMRLSKESLHASESYGGSSSSWKTQAI
jgi:hypothetical protein